MKTEFSVGGIVYSEGEYLILRYGMGHWGLVKGNRERGESKNHTILRELEEETGINHKNAKIIEGFEEETEYYYTLEGKKIYKRVIYLLLKVSTKNVNLSYEHSDYKWLSIKDAIDLVDFSNVKEILEKGHDFLKENELL